MNIIQDLSERVLTEDHLPYEDWESAQLNVIEEKTRDAFTSFEMEILRARPEVFRALKTYSTNRRFLAAAKGF